MALVGLVGIASAQVVPNTNQYGASLIGATAAWAAGYTGQGVLVTVADTGIDPNHPAFAGKIDPRSQAYVLSAPGAAFNASAISDLSAQSHGTHVAGTIAASGTSQAPGIAYNANLLVLKILASCATGQNCAASQYPNTSFAALNYFAAQADSRIYNASYGPEYTSPPGNFTIMPASFIDPSEADAVQKVLAANKIIVAATGNDRETSPIAGRNPSGLALYPFIRPGNANAGIYQNDNSNYDFSGLLNQPGIVVAVTSVGQAKTIAPYAQLCGVTASWCVAAPGGDQSKDAGIWSTLPNNNYGYMQGTSMAAPTVSGALAVLQQAYPSYTGRELVTVLFATAENVGGMLADNATYGYGLIRLDRAIAGPTTLAAGAQIAVPAQQVTYWSQPLTSAGAITMSGPGSLIIAGKTTATGAFSVTGGALGVDGSLTANGGLTVAQGAFLAGFGRIIGNTTISGTLNAGQLPNYADVAANSGGSLPAGTPLTGTSPGTLTFQGNVVLNATAVTRMNIDGALQVPGGPGTYDKIIITGAGNSFSIGGTLTPILRGIPGGNNNYSPAPGTVFQFITAQDGATLTGQFALSAPAEGLAANTRLDAVYTATTISLNVTPLSFQALATQQNLNPNAQAVAAALDTARPTPGARMAPKQSVLFNDLYDNDIAADDTELNALAGEGLAANPAIVLAALSGISDVLAERQTGLSDQPASGLTVWTQGYGQWSKVDPENGIVGSHSATSGIVLGADHSVTSGLVAGGALALSQARSTSGGVVSTTKTYAAAAYLSGVWDDWTFAGQLAGGAVSGHTSRDISISGTAETLTGAPGGWSLLADVEIGHRFLYSDVTIEPYAGLLAQTYHQAAYSEQGDVGLDLPEQDFSRVRTTLGLRLATAFTLAGLEIHPRADFGWAHDLGDAGLSTRAELFGEPFVIDAAQPGRDAARLGAGLSITLRQGFHLFAGYDGEIRHHATSQQVSGGIRITF